MKVCSRFFAISYEELKLDSRLATNPDRVKHHKELEEKLTKHFSRESCDYWVSKLSTAGVPCSRINTHEKILSDPFVTTRGMLIDCKHPKGRVIKQLGLPYHFRNFEFAIKSPPPLLGEHSGEILSAIGYSRREIQTLISNNIVKSQAF